MTEQAKHEPTSECPYCGVDPAREPCARLGWCLLTPSQRARFEPKPAAEDVEDE
jgi:hypothetical protein